MGSCSCVNPHYPCSACGWGAGSQIIPTSQTIPNWNQPITTPNSAPQRSSPLPDIPREIREDELDCARSMILLAERIQQHQSWREGLIEHLRVLANDLFFGEKN